MQAWKEGTPIPVITFLRDVLSMTKGPYYRLVGRNTQHFCTRAAAKAAGEQHKRALFIVAAGADEFLAGLLGLPNSKGGGPSSTSGTNPRNAKDGPQPVANKTVTSRLTAKAMRIYASTVLILLGADKEQMLRVSGLDETEWMTRWCFAFEYQQEDMGLFNEVLLPAYQQQGFEGLVATAAKAISEVLFPDNNGAFPMDGEAFKHSVVHDVSAILKRKH